MAIHPRERDANRRTIIDMLETTPIGVAPRHGSAASPDLLPDLDFDWRPQPMEKAVDARRTFRWSILFAAMALGVLALIAVQFLVTVPQQKADERRAEYRTALDEFAGALDTFAGAAAPSDPEALALFASAAADLEAVAAAPLPTVIPLLPIGPIEELRPGRSEMLGMVDAIEQMVTDLASAASYREAAADILALPLLPTEAPTELIDPAARAIADMQSLSESVFGRLDDDPAFGAYRDRVSAAIDAVDDWSVRYLLALRGGDVAATTTILAEMQARVSLANTELEIAVADLDAAARDTIAALLASVEEARVKLG